MGSQKTAEMDQNAKQSGVVSVCARYCRAAGRGVAGFAHCVQRRARPRRALRKHPRTVGWRVAGQPSWTHGGSEFHPQAALVLQWQHQNGFRLKSTSRGHPVCVPPGTWFPRRLAILPGLTCSLCSQHQEV